jgi:SNF2 family DNA or RNA helicase
MAIKKFKTTSMNVLLGSIDNTGLDLVNANHLIFVHALTGEDYMVKAAEDQAIARIQRTGQTKKVHVYWLITRGTIEEQIYLQTRVSK